MTEVNELYSLNLAKDYCPKWAEWEGIRELMQNCVDGGLISVEYIDGQLIFTNNGSIDRKALIMGYTTKLEGDLGVFGFYI